MKKHFQDLWVAMNIPERICWVGVLLSAVGVVVLSAYGLICQREAVMSNIVVPLLGLLQLCQAGYNWRQSRRVAVLSLVCAAVIIACAVAIWIL